MTTIRWSPQAADDLQAVRDFIARDSDHDANLVMQRIAAAIDLLATSPRMGRFVPELRSRELRELIVGAMLAQQSAAADGAPVPLASHGAPRQTGTLGDKVEVYFFAAPRY